MLCCSFSRSSALLSHATESVAAKTGDAIGGLTHAAKAFGMTPAFVGFIVARKNRLDLFVAPVLILLSYVMARHR